MTKYIFPVLLASLVFSACGPASLFEETHQIPESGWAYQDTINFTFPIADTAQVYDLFLAIKHSPEFNAQNLYTRIFTGFPSGERLSKVLSLELADKTGIWAGKCGSKSCTLEIPIQSNVFFNQTGDYTLTLEQYMRQDSIQGIQSIGLRLSKAIKEK